MEKACFDVYPFDDDGLDLLRIIISENIIKINNVFIPRSWKINLNDMPLNTSVMWGQPIVDESPGLLVAPSIHKINETSIVELVNKYLEQGKLVINLRAFPIDIINAMSKYSNFKNYYK